ncbi:MarR family winged helix-turn-helix transcriptional regulator [Pseudonocardia pini]|uniref:MarR family winged helix-turn-helix transcriptional regulator n=1 Tax=Pseudonocardia pini TaxID=2758030 RepID=UPI0015EFF803|nr:MarR family transcriptional regulator [Pseudonocardia pini]
MTSYREGNAVDAAPETAPGDAAATRAGDPQAHPRPTEQEIVAGRVGELVRRLGGEAGRLVELFARSRGMRTSDVHALTSIRLAELRDDPETPGDLSQALLLTSGAVTGLVDRLVRSGHVIRQPDQGDRRRVRLRSTVTGAVVAGDLLEMLGARTGGVVSGYSLAELTVVERFLMEIVAATTGYLWSLEAPRVEES